MDSSLVFTKWVVPVLILCVISSARANPPVNNSKIPPELQGVGITEHLGDKVSIQDLSFRDEAGKTVALSQYFGGGKPILLSLVYYECPNLCNLLLNGLVAGLRSLPWNPGEQFELISVSIDPKEGPDLAAKKKAAYLNSYGRPQGAMGWHFLTGEEKQIQKLASQVGFGYRYDEQEKQFAHSAALYVLTPEGKISRYLYGIQFFEKDLRLALLEASNGKIGSIVDRFLLFCYRYDPHTRKYSVYLSNIMRAGAAGTVLVFGSYLLLFWRRQRGLAVEHQGGSFS